MWILDSAVGAYNDAVRISWHHGRLASRVVFSGGIWNMGERLKMNIAVANWFDQTVIDNDKFIDHGLQNATNRALALWESPDIIQNVEGSLMLYGVGLTYALDRFVTTVAKGYVDVLRFGEGTLHKRTISGAGLDALRLMQVLPSSAMSSGLKWMVGAGRMKLLALAPKQLSTTVECTSNAAVRAALATGLKFFTRVMTLWEKSGVTPPRNPITEGLYIHEVVEALAKVGARVEPAAKVSTMAEVANAAARNPNSVVMFSALSNPVRAGGAITHNSHTLLASAIEGGVRFYDTNGALFRSLAAFEAVYKAAKPFEIAIVHEALAVQAAREAILRFGPGVMHMLALGVRQVPVVPLILENVAALTAGNSWMNEKHPAPPPGAPASSSTPQEVPEAPSAARPAPHPQKPSNPVPPQRPSSTPLYTSDGPPARKHHIDQYHRPRTLR